MFVPCPFVRAPAAVSAREILVSTLQRQQLVLEPTNGRLVWDEALKDSTLWIRCGSITGWRI
jgi:hypothetical protein